MRWITTQVDKWQRIVAEKDDFQGYVIPELEARSDKEKNPPDFAFI